MPGKVGKTISHYRILEELGGGGMGVVYKAQDLKLNRLVALKFLTPELLDDEKAKHRFIHEARFASALDHLNIYTIHEINETPAGELFICMAYYEGETLQKKLQSGQLAVEVILDIAGQIAAGLARAHEAGIVHRDIKPANVIPRYRYRLAKLYEEHGQSARALEEYQRFLGFWEGADPTLPEMIDAVTRVAALREMTSG